jgi:hypothetical protein
MNPNFFQGTIVEEAATKEMVANGLLLAATEAQ